MAITPSSISSSEAFGSTTLCQVIAPIGIESEETFGSSLTLLRAGGAGESLPDYTIYLNGVDRSEYVRTSSISISQALASQNTARLSWIDRAGSLAPELDDEIVVYEGSTRLFAGQVVNTDTTNNGGTSDDISVNVTCTDWGVFCDRRVVAKKYDLFHGGSLPIIVADIVSTVLSGTGITFANDWTPTVSVGEQTYHHVPVSEVFDDLATAVEGYWCIDPWKTLRFFPETGYAAAPYTFTTDDERFAEPHVVRTRNKYWNRVYAKTNWSIMQTWVDTITAIAGQTSFETTYVLSDVPAVFVDDVEQKVVAFTEIATQEWDYYYIKDGIGVFAKTAPSAGASVEIQYPSPLSRVAMAEDKAEIAAHNLYEHVIEKADVADIDSLQAIADGELVRGLIRPTEFTGKTRLSGFRPGQLLTVNIGKPAVNDTLLIESVSSQEVGQQFFWHTIKAVDRPHYNADPVQYFRALIARSRNFEDRIVERITFTLAETIEGLTNPGLSTGLKDASKQATKFGYLREVSLRFNSVDGGTLTESVITIDVLKNGTSIFAGGGITYPVGKTGIVRNWRFASDPLSVEKGDVFKPNVIAADPLAKDGVLEIVVQG